MVKPSKRHKQLQLRLNNVWAARWPSGLTPVTPTGSSAPSSTTTTPPESLTLWSFELEESDGQDQHVYSLSNSPLHQEGPVSPNHSAEPEGADEGYRSDDLMSEMDSDDCMNSLERQKEWEVGFLESIRDAEQPDTFGALMRNVSDKEWRKAEPNQSLGYNGLSKRKEQLDKKKARDAEEKNKILRQRSVKTSE